MEEKTKEQLQMERMEQRARNMEALQKFQVSNYAKCVSIDLSFGNAFSESMKNDFTVQVWMEQYDSPRIPERLYRKYVSKNMESSDETIAQMIADCQSFIDSYDEVKASWLKEHVSPEDIIADLKSKLEQAEARAEIAENKLNEYVKEDK